MESGLAYIVIQFSTGDWNTLVIWVWALWLLIAFASQHHIDDMLFAAKELLLSCSYAVTALHFYKLIIKLQLY